jgi:hypothetical protein
MFSHSSTFFVFISIAGLRIRLDEASFASQVPPLIPHPSSSSITEKWIRMDSGSDEKWYAHNIGCKVEYLFLWQTFCTSHCLVYCLDSNFFIRRLLDRARLNSRVKNKQTANAQKPNNNLHHDERYLPVAILIFVGLFPWAYNFHPFLYFRSKHCNFDLSVTPPFESALSRIITMSVERSPRCFLFLFCWRD